MSVSITSVVIMTSSSSIRYLIRVTTSSFKSINRNYHPSKRSEKNQSSEMEAEMANMDDSRKKPGPHEFQGWRQESRPRLYKLNTVDRDGRVRKAY
ncbi:hypothetical protein BCON_0540g00020 [Botryotinia convoluta]|uniref:Uncharacterized protein n=1 Tax=Botryotinia convoluta TaxID=54673 RepID=A0A4Z1H597_9HELO|nr:hypothetical protein BCON_0540g00020 [Botryotinia convoluta]